MTPTAVAATLAAFVDVLLPGDEDFPSASTVGAQGLLAERLRQRLGADSVATLAERLSLSGPFADADAATKVTIVQEFERNEPVLFAVVYMVVCFSYYQHPTVTATIRALGHDYKDSPQPDGYEMPKFDFTPGVNVPMKPKGTFKWTEWLEPIDISSLAHLNLPMRKTVDKT